MEALQAQLLDLWVLDDAQCTSKQPHRCSGRAYYMATPKCGGAANLWCISREVEHRIDLQNERGCRYCKGDLVECWTVRPI